MTPMNKPKAPSTSSNGWLVKANQGYYTGQPYALARWTPFPKLAKVYHRQRWAQTMATRLGGQAIPAVSPNADTSHRA